MLPLLALIPIVIAGSALMVVLIKILSRDTKKKISECKKLAILGDRGSGKTTLWNGLRGKRTSGGYTQTMGLENIDSSDIKTNGRTVTIEKGADTGGGDDYVLPNYSKLLSGSKTVLFYLVSAVDLMERERDCSIKNVSRMHICQGLLGEGSVIILLLTHKNKFLKKYGLSSIPKLIKRSHSHFADCGCDGHIPVELTNSDDIEAIKKLIIR